MPGSAARGRSPRRSSGRTAEMDAARPAPCPAAAYERLSREDGDRAESDSILSQQRVIEDYCDAHAELYIAGHYADDGFTGTNFDRPAFDRMLADLRAGKVRCVIVKDLSRFGRDYIDMGYYLERVFPALGVRFIAVNDAVDSANGPYDMLLPLKNVFNAQYAKDISCKVRSAFAVKQKRGEFVGAFAPYGYRKDPERRGHLLVDPVAAAVVRRIFSLSAQGVGQVRVAQLLNDEGIPCPSEYKRLLGEKYRNANRLGTTCYWTYSTIHKLVRSETYLGSMVQHRSVRPAMHARARSAGQSEWIVVENTHEPIVSRELWDAVQAQLGKHSRTPDFTHNTGLLAGFLRCGDCGRAMVKTVWGGRTHYSCGSYRRYGFTACTKHYIPQQDIEDILLRDLNRVLAQAGDLACLVSEEAPAPEQEADEARLHSALERVRRLSQSAYEDHRDGLLRRDEFLRYRADYAQQEAALAAQLALLRAPVQEAQAANPWLEDLLRGGCLRALDRPTLAQTVQEIRVFEGRHIAVTYLFSDALRGALEDSP